MTEFEKSGKLELAREVKAKGRPTFWRDVVLYGFIGLTPVNRRGSSEYRTWTIEQLALATAYLLGPDEPLLAAEVSVYDVWDTWSRKLAVVVTAAHVLVFRFESAEGQPRRIAMARRATDVKIEPHTGLSGFFLPGFDVTDRTGRWTIQGFQGDKFNSDPVIVAWRQAVKNAR